MMMVAVSLAAGSMTAQAEMSPSGVIAVEQFNKLEQCMKNITTILSQVKDTESADAMAEKFVEATRAMTEQMVAMEAMGKELKEQPNEDDLAAFEQCRNNLQAAGFDMQTEMRRLSMVNFYESEKFISALMTMQQGM